MLREWEQVLNDLERDVSLAGDRVDWVAKKNLLGALQSAEKLSWSDPWLQAIDLEYHNIMPEDGLHHELIRQGSMRRVVTDEEITAAISMPPETTRAYFRGRAVAKFSHAIRSIQWDEIVFDDGTQKCRVRFPEVATDQRLEALNQAVREEKPLAEFLRALPSE